MAFFGPNGEILGNIRLTIWHYQAITDIGAFTETIGTLLCVDFLSFLINGILLWTFCKINIVIELKNLQKQFWFYMACMEAVVFLEVLLTKALASQFHYKFNFSQIFGQICIGSGHDLTLGFDWLDGKYILNSTFDA